MPLVRILTSVAGEDFSFGVGEEVELPGQRAGEFVAAGWGELVRGRPVETPESSARETGAPETAVSTAAHNRGGRKSPPRPKG